MNPLWWLIRARRWVQHPPSKRRIAIVFITIGIAVAIYALDHAGLWPEWAQNEPHRLRRLWH